ncbi:DNA repair protein RecN (Recombination protein N) [Hathewaya proteolytica DSM 3090]|uniref:DNA repair protein RecN n=1 Tax=Hathewaya proteolytica DSM 3090 TaxID=1121331 RepID=A0A1M6L406_9CLOT|nr:DNA repair protein RecN [Hathewaya proteolytica]SHJ65926.1 DNA repair protein RecN (Recombination protein N) [Hathewaya proteolytica DSM 3090]
MLLKLNIDNFALIDHASMDFNKGFNIILGETGSGKSILIDAINFLIGGKFSKNFLRTGESKTYVEGIFTLENEQSKLMLQNLNIPFQDDIIVISREGNSLGKSFAKINNRTVVLSVLRDFCKNIMDIHEQHETQNALNSCNHINYLDSFSRNALGDNIKNYKVKYSEYASIRSKIDDLEIKKNQDIRKKEFLKFQLDDISKYNIIKGEEEQLLEEYKVLNNAETIKNKLSLCHELLYASNDNEQCAFDLINEVVKNLRFIEDNYKEAKVLADSFEEMYYVMEDNIRRIKTMEDDTVCDEIQLNAINERLYNLEGLKKKYNVSSLNELLEYKEKLQIEYDELENININMEELLKEESKVKKLLLELGERIHEIRLKESEKLKYNMEEQFKFVGLEKVSINIQISTDNSFMENGIDKVEFFIRTNVGEPFKPLKEIVSGGELSRIMLCFKSTFSNVENIPSMIFDEIDTGISGVTAQRVGEKMFSISKNRQVFCITHLPQIACFFDNCYLVWKVVENEKTYSKIKLATEDEIINAIAKMQAGDNISKLSVEHAKELIENAKKIKSKV